MSELKKLGFNDNLCKKVTSKSNVTDICLIPATWSQWIKFHSGRGFIESPTFDIEETVVSPFKFTRISLEKANLKEVATFMAENY